jgi:hypothetical protein
MVWEYIDGTNIQKWIAQNGPMPARLSIEISIQALMGLDHLHSMGLIHRDISPENIMLSQDHHGKLLVKVIDFGIAKSLAEGESGHGLTQTGMFLGKLKYASPEQAGFLKEGEHIDPRSDLYSFGIVMYEMLAGRAPFQATNPHGYILKHVTEKPAPITELNPEVHTPPQLEAIIMRSLEKSREARYATAAEFAAALESIRNSVAPDSKYGLGEKLITLSGAKTLADLPAFTGGTISGSTKPSPTVGGTRSGADDATVIERGITPQTVSGSAPTVAERKMTIGSNDATVMEKGVVAAPTVLEAKAKWAEAGGAAPTVLERQVAPPAPKKSVGLIATIAAAIVIAIGAGIFYVTRKQGQQTTGTVTGTQAGTVVTATATPGPPIPADRGQLLLSASPWGDLEKIVDVKDQKSVPLSDEMSSTPARIDLPPGKYNVTVAGPEGTQTVEVSIVAGKKTPRHVDFKQVDVDSLINEIGSKENMQ